MADTFGFELKGVKEALKMFNADIIKNATRQALNRTATAGKTTASKIIREEYNIRATDVSEFLSITERASGYKMQAVISGRGKGLALAKFGAKQEGKFIIYTGRGKARRGHLGSKYARGYAGAVTVQVKRSSGRKVVTGKYSNKPFIAQMKSGHIGIWVRIGKDRKKIEQLLGPGVGGLFGSKGVMPRVKKLINDRFGPEFQSQLKYYLGRAK